MKRQRIDEGAGEGEWLLPQPITQQILSYLSEKDAASMSLVSKNLYSAWSTKPILNLDFNEVDEADKQSLNDRRLNRQEFVNFALKSIQRYHNQQVCIQLLHLSIACYSCKDSTDFITKLVDNIEKAAPKIKELHVSYISSGQGFNLPEEIFKFKALTQLDVDGIDSLIPEFGDRGIKCSLLRRLVLRRVRMDNGTLERLISSCPLIETLKLVGCGGLHRIKVSNLVCLKECVIDTQFGNTSEDPEIEIEAPALESFYYRSTSKFKLHCPCLKLKKLYVRDSGIEEGLFQNLGDKFPNLEKLSIKDCYGYGPIEISNNNRLKSVKVLGLEEEEMNIISAPSLVSFSHQGYSIPCFNCCVSKCECYISIIANENLLVASWFVRLKESLSHLNGSTISLDIYLTGLDYIDNLSSCSSYRAGALVENLRIDFLEVMEEDISSSSYAAFVDNLFWCCRPKTVNIEWSTTCNIQLINHICSRLMDRRIPDYGNKSGEFDDSCWENHLEEVKIQFPKGRQLLTDDCRILVDEPCADETIDTIFKLKWHKELQVDS